MPGDRAWFDPALIAANLYLVQTDIPVDPVESLPAAKLNIYRWAVGFIQAPDSGNGARVAPYVDVQTGIGYLVPTDEILWFDMPTYGPLVFQEWRAVGGAGAIVRVIEVIRRTMGK